MVDPREIEAGDQVRQSSKPLSHLVKIDKAGAMRTMCGVPIRPGHGWTNTTGDLSCPTCQAASAKPQRTGGPPEAPSTISRAPAECVYDKNGIRKTSPTGRHIRSVLRSNYHGEVQQPWCTWCGQLLEPEAPLPAPTDRNLVTDATDVF